MRKTRKCNPAAKGTRFVTLLLILALALTMAPLTALAEPAAYLTVVYAPDGRTMSVSSAERQYYLASGWYEYPVTYVYLPSGQNMVVYQSEVYNYLAQGWYLTPMRTMYAPDGRVEVVTSDMASVYATLGWYDTPVTTMYLPDGTSTVVPWYSVTAYSSWGWYLTPVTTLYAVDGSSIVTATENVPAYVAAGWHTNKWEIFTTMFSLDGSTQEVPNIYIPREQAKGWYLYPDYIVAWADSLVWNLGYEGAIEALDQALWNGDGYYDVYAGKRAMVLEQWHQAAGAPLAVLGNTLQYDGTGMPTVVLHFRNLTTQTITRIDSRWVCRDMYGRSTSSAGYSGTYEAWTVPGQTLAAGSADVFNWPLYMNRQTAFITEFEITKVEFADGTVWRPY